METCFGAHLINKPTLLVKR